MTERQHDFLEVGGFILLTVLTGISVYNNFLIYW